MKEKKITDEVLMRLEDLVLRLERANEKTSPQHPHLPVQCNRPLPHHMEEKSKLKIDFDVDKKLLVNMFADEDTVKAVIEIMMESPTEIQILFKVVLDLYNQINTIIEK
jgi:hypothetical protein